MKNKSQPRIAIYTRTATRDQNSDENAMAQENNCRDFIFQKFGKAFSSDDYISVYSDIGCSGLEMSRPGFQSLWQDAKNGLIKTVIFQDYTRLSRKMTDIALICEDLSHLGIEIHSLHSGVFIQESFATKNVGVL